MTTLTDALRRLIALRSEKAGLESLFDGRVKKLVLIENEWMHDKVYVTLDKWRFGFFGLQPALGEGRRGEGTQGGTTESEPHRRSPSPVRDTQAGVRRMKTIYVVEMWCESVGRWLPTVGVGITPADGKDTLTEWQRKNPDDTFRLRAYSRRPGDHT